MHDHLHDPWNHLRLAPRSRKGHVESYFVKANDPDPSSGRAIWIRFTLLAPRARPSDTVVEVWAVVFDRALGRPLAARARFPLAGAQIDPVRPRIDVGGAHFEPGWTRGRLASEGGTGDGAWIEWDLRWPRLPGRAGALALYPSRALYEAPFPSTKVVSPEPDTTLAGSVFVEPREGPARRMEVLGWPGMQGHNWGRRHALRYAWAHANAFAGAPGAVLEAASAQVPLGPLPFASPLLTVALARLPGGASHGAGRGREIDMRGPLLWWNPTADVRVSAEGIRYSFSAESASARLTASLEAPLEETALLRYEDPDGGVAWCRNAKTARVTLDVAARPEEGGALAPLARLEGVGALEVLTREADPGRAPDA